MTAIANPHHRSGKKIPREDGVAYRWSLANRLRDACSKPREKIVPLVGCGYPGAGKILDRSGLLLRPQIFGAQRFFLDDEVTRIVSTIGLLYDPLDDNRAKDGVDWDDPSMLHAAMPRCRAPFTNTWIEWPNLVRMAAAGETPSKTASEIVGCIVEQLPGYDSRYRITTVGSVPDEKAPMGGTGRVSVMPFSIVYDLTSPIDASPDHVEIFDIIKDVSSPDDSREDLYASIVMGTTFVRARRSGNKSALDVCRDISKRSTLTWSPWTGDRFREAILNNFGDKSGLVDWRTDARDVLAISLMQGCGNLRFVLGVLALVNSRAETGETGVSWGGCGVGGKSSRRYLDHRTVMLTVPREQAVQMLGRSFGYDFGRRRRHPVRGSWCHGRTGERAGNPNCVHDYDTTDPLRQTCTRCGAARWWRAEHERGDASLGYVTHDYHVEVSR